MNEWFVCAKWRNPQSGNVHRHTFRAKGNTMQQAMESAISEAVQLWSCNRHEVIIFEAGRHVSLAEAAEERRLAIREKVAGVIYNVSDVDTQIDRLTRMIERGVF
jgi:hypothetical protein